MCSCLDRSEIRDSQSFLGVLAVVQQLKVWGAICSKVAVRESSPSVTLELVCVWDSLEIGAHYITSLDWL